MSYICLEISGIGSHASIKVNFTNIRVNITSRLQKSTLSMSPLKTS